MIPTFDLANSLRAFPADAGIKIFWNPSDKTAGITLSNGNRTAAAPNDAVYEGVRTTYVFNSDTSRKLYWEVDIDVATASDIWVGLFVESVALVQGAFALGGGDPAAVLRNSGAISGSIPWVANGSGSSFTAGDLLMFAYDESARKLFAGKNGTWFNSSDPAAGTNASWTNGPSATDLDFIFHTDNNSGANQLSIRAPGSHSYSTPSGFTAI